MSHFVIPEALCNNRLSHFVVLDTLCNKFLSNFAIPDALCNNLLPYFVIPDALCYKPVTFCDKFFQSHFVTTVSLCNSTFIYYLPKFRKGNYMWTKFWGDQYPTYQWHNFSSRDQVTNYKRHSATIMKATISKRGGNTYISGWNTTILICHVM